MDGEGRGRSLKEASEPVRSCSLSEPDDCAVRCYDVAGHPVNFALEATRGCRSWRGGSRQRSGDLCSYSTMTLENGKFSANAEQLWHEPVTAGISQPLRQSFTCLAAPFQSRA
jgi:hypothetical protein